jgi:hypothetical protein
VGARRGADSQCDATARTVAMTIHTSADRIGVQSRVYGPPPAPSPPPAATTGREIVDRHTSGSKTDAKAVASDLRNEIRARPQDATKLTMQAMEQVKADDRDELAQEFVRAHSDAELKTLGQNAAGKGALALAVNELSKSSVYKDEAEDARRVGTALGAEVDIKVNSGWSWERVSGAVHTVLDVAGFIPGLGAIPDLINAGIYAAEGDLANAALSATAAVPVAGDAIKGGTMAVKAGRQIAKHGDEALDAGKQVVKHGDEVLDAGKTVAKKSTDDAAQTAAAKGTHAPNATATHNGYTYKTDGQGRVSEVSGELNLNNSQGRSAKAQREAGGADRRVDDQGGHFVGRRFDGPTESVNHFAQNANFNNSAFKKLENAWEKALADGKKIEVQMRPSYSNDSLRPDRLEVRWSVDGKWTSKSFYNEVGGAKPPQG